MTAAPGFLINDMADYIPEHYVPTSFHKNWQGKIKCAYCNQAGWPVFGHPIYWTNKHGEFCSQRPLIEAK